MQSRDSERNLEDESMDDRTFKHIVSKMKSSPPPKKWPKSTSEMRVNVDYEQQKLGMNPSVGVFRQSF